MESCLSLFIFFPFVIAAVLVPYSPSFRLSVTPPCPGDAPVAAVAAACSN